LHGIDQRFDHRLNLNGIGLGINGYQTRFSRRPSDANLGKLNMKLSNRRGGMVASHPPHLRDPSHLHPLHHKDISRMIPDRAVGRDELAGDELFAGFATQSLPAAVAEDGDGFVLFVEDGDAGVEVGDEEIGAALVEVAREFHLVGDEAGVAAVEREVLDAVICTVRDGEPRRAASGVHPDPVRA